MNPLADMYILCFGIPPSERHPISRPDEIYNFSQSPFGQKFERLVQAYQTENSAILRNSIMQFRSQICTECENDDDPDCLCPLLALPLTQIGRQVLERERREQAMHPACSVNEARESD